MVGVAVGEVPELLGLVEAPLQVLRGHEVLRHFDAVVDVTHLNTAYLIRSVQRSRARDFTLGLEIIFPSPLSPLTVNFV